MTAETSCLETVVEFWNEPDQNYTRSAGLLESDSGANRDLILLKYSRRQIVGIVIPEIAIPDEYTDNCDAE